MSTSKGKKRYIIASKAAWWGDAYPDKLSSYGDFVYILSKKDLSMDIVESISPRYIFFIHWSWIVPKEIHENYECVVFHMTDLPYGRGGSPLQNLIVRGHEKTKISAIRMTEELDAGPIYMKRTLSLEGSAKEIFQRASRIMFSMIEEIVQKEPAPIPQEGEPVIFKRRTPEMSHIPDDLNDIKKVYDYIRMLDAPGYPPAFIRHGKFIYEFSNASLHAEKSELNANVKIRKIEDES